jgi:ATP-dependent RNA helicase RhlE
LGKVFKKIGLKVAAFHSDLEQKDREAIMLDFKNSKIDVLVGTDVLSRGIDVTGIDLVINYDAPQDPEDYIHRIGRTARAATKGTAITLVNSKDKRRLANIEKLIERQIERMPLPDHVGEAPKEEPTAGEQNPTLRKRNSLRKSQKLLVRC